MNALVDPGVRPLAVNQSQKPFPAFVNVKPEKVAMPLIAVTVVMPWSIPAPRLPAKETVTRPLKSGTR